MIKYLEAEIQDLKDLAAKAKSGGDFATYAMILAAISQIGLAIKIHESESRKIARYELGGSGGEGMH